ncbi:T9SS type A sorting domain-containing protein [Hymenobacter cellulosivorans]|uniref:T9SS type A sorting domain-containing protein n=1 Tax=Hymenobacter cellulosivorans TaxID=2932249 RepID=A0ABY4FCN1_9BACT|nr:T9SS type A sorting domain-containing protein [Hymenobacter cellulosivorans]UOQ54412.1 T9SS type A sorting domain-containing protein [Hymenobacter cellulosivorans]
MRKLLQAGLILACSLLGATQGSAQALDGTFIRPTVLQSATVDNAVQQADGKFIVAGNFTRVNGDEVAGLARLNADGTADTDFNNTTYSRSTITKVRLLTNGQIILQGYGNLTVAGRTTHTLAKINANGTPVADFMPGSGPAGSGPAALDVAAVAVQADNKIVVGGSFVSYSGVVAKGLVRLNANGSVDQAFATALGAGFTRSDAVAPIVRGVVVQPDGKLLVCGNFMNYNGSGRSGLLRLNPDGSLDTTFNPVSSTMTSGFDMLAVALDPRTNNIVAATTNFSKQLVRLTPTGQEDASFALTSNPGCISYGTSNSDELAVDASGRVLLSSCFGNYGGANNSYLTRFLANGQPDTQFAIGNKLDGRVLSVRPLANGQVLIGGSFSRYGSLHNVNMLVLDANGQAQSTPLPRLMQTGTVLAIKQQADGKLVVGGRFWEINGQAAANVARLNSDGTLDPAFDLTGVNGQVRQVAIATDGRIVVGGVFTATGSVASNQVARLLSDGRPDATFTAPAPDPRGAATVFGVYAMALQTDGKVLRGGSSLSIGGYTSTIHRLLPNGAIDAAYATQAGSIVPASTVYAIENLPDNKHYIAGAGQANQPSLVRLNADGSRDNSFAAGVAPSNAPMTIQVLQSMPNGKLLAGGSFTSYNGASAAQLVQLNADGTVDTNYTLPTLTGSAVVALARYANGRVLAGSSFLNVNGVARGSLVRFNPDGSYDASFANVLTNGFLGFPSPGALVLQADEKILLSGLNLLIDGQSRAPLTRLTASNVLAVSSRQSTARTEAWPNPAHAALHLSLEATAKPSQVVLLDALGKTVLSQPVASPELTLPVQELRAGIYLLRVHYADGPVTRRVVLE